MLGKPFGNQRKVHLYGLWSPTQECQNLVPDDMPSATKQKWGSFAWHINRPEKNQDQCLGTNLLDNSKIREHVTGN
jgi:hypothetical protein